MGQIAHRLGPWFRLRYLPVALGVVFVGSFSVRCTLVSEPSDQGQRQQVAQAMASVRVAVEIVLDEAEAFPHLAEKYPEVAAALPEVRKAVALIDATSEGDISGAFAELRKFRGLYERFALEGLGWSEEDTHLSLLAIRSAMRYAEAMMLAQSYETASHERS